MQQESSAALKRRLNALRNEARAARTNRKRLVEECAAVYAELRRRAALEADAQREQSPLAPRTRPVGKSQSEAAQASSSGSDRTSSTSRDPGRNTLSDRASSP